MAGILNSKERFMDFQLTAYGRKQLSKGELKFSFATVSDRGTFYSRNSDDVLAASDSSTRICLESFSTPHDQVYLKPDDDGFYHFQTGSFLYDSEKIYVLNDKTVNEVGNDLRGSQIFSGSNALIQGTLNKLENLRPVSRRIKSPGKFELGIKEHAFISGEDTPIPWDEPRDLNIQTIESFHQDYRLSELDNYELLPPINTVSRRPLREYVDTRQKRPDNVQELFERIGLIQTAGKISKKQFVDVQFKNTGPARNFALQVFETNSKEGTVDKLTLIDYGKIDDINPFLPGRHVAFVGKIIKKDNAAKESIGMGSEVEGFQNINQLSSEDVFINIFTLVFD